MGPPGARESDPSVDVTDGLLSSDVTREIGEKVTREIGQKIASNVSREYRWLQLGTLPEPRLPSV